jgi:heme-degrading monooxygenase HmoA
MFARVSTTLMPKDKIDALNKVAMEKTFPGSKKQTGYKGFLTMINPDTGERLTVSLWETEADMKASEKAPYFMQVSKEIAASGVKVTSTKYFTVGIKD